MNPEARSFDVFSTSEIARAAGVAAADAEALVESGAVLTTTGGWVRGCDAVKAVQLLRGVSVPTLSERHLFQPPPRPKRRRGFPLVAAGVVHAAIVLVIVMLTTLEVSGGISRPPIDLRSARLVFLALPGPGGGGGGGGLKQPKPAARAEKKGRGALRSPVPVQRVVRSRTEPPEVRPTPPPAPTPVERPIEPLPAAKPDPVPPITAPVVPAEADPQERAGVVIDSAPESTSRGPGNGGGSGSGEGTGMGEGTGAGIGPGTVAGTGGGPYRPGSGITPPALLREVKPDYTEEARRRNLAGEVVLEIVVRNDGTVGDVRVMRGLGAGLDRRAVDAVRQWRFSPARRHGTPVDVMVEVAVEFKLR